MEIVDRCYMVVMADLYKKAVRTTRSGAPMETGRTAKSIDVILTLSRAIYKIYASSILLARSSRVN